MKVKELADLTGLQPTDEVLVVNAEGLGPILVPVSELDTGPTESEINSLVDKLALSAHPVNSYYWSHVSTDPASLFGGTWVRVSGVFLYGRESSMSVGASGGSKTVQLSVAQMPAHSHPRNSDGGFGVVPSHTHNVIMDPHVHYISGHSHTVNGHNHTISHNHSFSHTHTITGLKVTGDEASKKYYGLGFTGYGTDQALISSSAGSTAYGPTKAIMQTATSSTATSAYSGTLTSGSHSTTGTVASAYASQAGTNNYASVSLTITCGTTFNNISGQGAGGYGHDTNVGSGQAHDNMPPYIGAYCWRRTS